MEWEIVVHDEPRYLEVITSGIADNHGSLEMAKAITSAMRTDRITKALIDHRKVVSVTGNVVDIYERPKIFRIIGAMLRIRIAEIINSEHWEHFHFLETVCVNQGYQISVFQDKEQALAWLLK